MFIKLLYLDFEDSPLVKQKSILFQLIHLQTFFPLRRLLGPKEHKYLRYKRLLLFNNTLPLLQQISLYSVPVTRHDFVLKHEILITEERPFVDSLVISKFELFLLLIKYLNLIRLPLQLPDLLVNFKFELEHLSVYTSMLVVLRVILQHTFILEVGVLHFLQVVFREKYLQWESATLIWIKSEVEIRLQVVGVDCFQECLHGSMKYLLASWNIGLLVSSRETNSQVVLLGHALWIVKVEADGRHLAVNGYLNEEVGAFYNLEGSSFVSIYDYVSVIRTN